MVVNVIKHQREAGKGNVRALKRAGTSAKKEVLEVLLVEDNLGDAELLRIAFERAKGDRNISLHHVENLSSAISLLEKGDVDVVILDLSLPDSFGMESLRQIKHQFPYLPVIIFTGWDDRTAALEGIRSGAQDYLIKGSFDYGMIVSTLDYAIERQRIRNATEGRQLQIQQENEFKKEVLEVVAHDLRSPLAGVLMQLEGILSGSVIKDLSPEQRRTFQLMHNNCNQVIELTRDLLDLESLKSKDFYVPQTVNLVPYLQKTFESFLPLAGRKAIEMRFEMAPTLPLVFADPRRIAQAVNNLLSNAIKFSYENTEIVLSAAVQGNELVISVKDQGQGIPQEDCPKLFLEFSRTRVRPTAGEDSAGMGLAIVKRIADAHSGRVWVETELGKGSTFFFAMPIRAI